MIQVESRTPRRRSPQYHTERLRVTLHPNDLRGHRVVAMGKFLLVGKKLSPDGKIILWFENAYTHAESVWTEVGRNGIIRIPLEVGVAKSYSEGSGYSLYLYKW